MAALHLAGMVLAGSVGGFAGLGAAAGIAALGFAWLARGRRRLAAVAALAVLGAAGAGLGVRFFDASRTATVALDGPVVEWPGGAAVRYVGRVHLKRPSVQSRLAAWEAGLEGFAERPLLGWGPGNYAAVFGQFGDGYAATAEPHDQAHGKLVETAATTGAAGLAAWLALWGLALAVLLGAARHLPPPERAFAVFAAAALGGHLVQIQFLFDTAVGMLLATLLLAFAAGLEDRALPARLRLAGWIEPLPLPRWGAALRRAGARVALGAAAVSLALGGLAVNRAILVAADNRHVAPHAITSGAIVEGIDAFPPLAYLYRRFFFENLARVWPYLRARHPARAAALLERADLDAADAVRNDPWNWHIEHALAQLYRAVAGTEPGYEARAAHHLARARELAPGRAVFPAPLEPPGEMAARRLSGDRLELQWRLSPGAGYHQIARAAESGVWRTVLYAYGLAPGTFVGPAGPFRYRIKACRYPAQCSAWREWP